MTSVFLHLDMDAFYVSVEELENPALRGLPVVVGGPRDARGVVAAASYAARRFGVHSAMPSRTAARLCPQAVFLPPRFELYQQRSRQVHAVLGDFAPVVTMVSVDEAYLDITGCERLYGTPLAAATQLRDRIVSATRLPCSIGASSSHLVCKVASDYAKPRGLLWIVPGGEAAFLGGLPVAKVPGIGAVTAAALARIGIRTMGDIARTDAALLDELFGNFGPVLRRKVLGLDADHDTGAAFLSRDARRPPSPSRRSTPSTPTRPTPAAWPAPWRAWSSRWRAACGHRAGTPAPSTSSCAIPSSAP